MEKGQQNSQNNPKLLEVPYQITRLNIQPNKIMCHQHMNKDKENRTPELAHTHMETVYFGIGEERNSLIVLTHILKVKG